jgi:hypothetical protein
MTPLTPPHYQMSTTSGYEYISLLPMSDLKRPHTSIPSVNPCDGVVSRQIIVEW